MFKKSENHNPNYLAEIVRLQKPVVHPNAHSLQGWIIKHNRVWTNMDYNEGNICVYFPIECCINPELLSYLNLFRDKKLNTNIEQSGFFEHHGRVRALKLRGEPSEGFLLKIEQVKDWLSSKVGNVEWTDLVEFDFYNDIWICKKYIPLSNKKEGNSSGEKKSKIGLIEEGQFNFHYDTLKLAAKLEEFTPDDIIVITRKIHGSSHISSKLLVKRKLNIFEKILSALGVKVQKSEYEYVYSSRKVVKSVGENVLSTKGFYKEDIWKIAHDRLKPYLSNGQTIYCELYGYIPNTSSFIQGGYNYGLSPGTMDLQVYRITTTSSEGIVHEWDWDSVKQWCNKFNIKHVEELYYGVPQLLPSYSSNPNWHEAFFEDIKINFLEKDAADCVGNPPDEGICIMNLSKKKWRKYKSFAFLKNESEMLDKGEIDIES